MKTLATLTHTRCSSKIISYPIFVLAHMVCSESLLALYPYTLWLVTGISSLFLLQPGISGHSSVCLAQAPETWCSLIFSLAQGSGSDFLHGASANDPTPFSASFGAHNTPAQWALFLSLALVLSLRQPTPVVGLSAGRLAKGSKADKCVKVNVWAVH